MKKILLFIFVMFIGIGVVNAAANVTVPESITIEATKEKTVEIELTDIVALMDLKSSDNNIAYPVSEYLDLHTEGNTTMKGKFVIKALAPGTATLTISSEDAAEFSSGDSYDFPEKTITINVLDEVIEEEKEDKAEPKKKKEDKKTKKSNKGIIIIVVIAVILLGGFVFIKSKTKKRRR